MRIPDAVVMRCEEHPDLPWPHGDCPGPGVLVAAAPREAYQAFVCELLEQVRGLFEPERRAEVRLTLAIRLPWADDGKGSGVWVISDDEAHEAIAAIRVAAALTSS